MFGYDQRMEPAEHRLLVLQPQTEAVWGRLERVLAEQGDPPVSMSVDAGGITFKAQTGDFMLRARVADALMSVCGHGDWTRTFQPLD
jgi:hypothetical protein